MSLHLPDPSTVDPLTDAELASIPVFPLPRVVFFPGTALPLHLFEDRYRAMIDDCMSRGPRVLAVTLLKPGWEDAYQGRPPIHEIAGVGRIVAHESLPDGRHNVILLGLGRARLEELPTDTPYRRARATLLPDIGEASTNDVTSLWSVASSMIAAVRREHPEFALGVDAEDAPSTLADVLADRFVADVDRRQAILETRDVRERIRLVTDVLGELLALLSSRDDGMLH